MTITVLIPTYRRPDDLRRCLTALSKQQRPADELRIVVRSSDEQSQAVSREFIDRLPIAVTHVTIGGVIAAMTAGLQDATGQIICMTDDDSAPWPDWIARIEQAFESHPEIGGVGGRDWVYHGQALEPGDPQSTVGLVQWYGRIIGGHHLAVGSGRMVDVLKGVNCAYRADLLRSVGFDTRLLGNGAQGHWELGVCLALRRRGVSLWFDPAIAVNHHPGQRFDEDGRNTFNALARRNDVHNETLFLLDHFSRLQRIVLMMWAIGIGTSHAPGLLQMLRLKLRGERQVLERFKATCQGRWMAFSRHAQEARRSAVAQKRPEFAATSSNPAM